jgi:FHA domain-containing protein
MRLKRHSATAEAETWKCDACGAFNDPSDTICSECSAKKLETLDKPTSMKDKKQEESPSVMAAETRDFEDKPTAKKDKKKEESLFGMEAETRDFETAETKTPLTDEPPSTETISSLDEPSETPATPEPIDTMDNPEPKEEPSAWEAPSSTPESPSNFETTTPPTVTTGQSWATGQASTTGTGRYYFVFVSSPSQSMVKSKVQIDFETFPVVSIGRSPENIVVLPDQEVSRKHAELTMEGDKLMLKDMSSKNGTFLYDGKKFQPVTDSVELKPNTVVKFGTGTILRLTSE